MMESCGPARYEPATGNPRLNGVVIEADDKTGRALSINRVSYSEKDLAAIAPGERAGERVKA